MKYLGKYCYVFVCEEISFGLLSFEIEEQNPNNLIGWFCCKLSEPVKCANINGSLGQVLRSKINVNRGLKYILLDAIHNIVTPKTVNILKIVCSKFIIQNVYRFRSNYCCVFYQNTQWFPQLLDTQSRF